MKPFVRSLVAVVMAVISVASLASPAHGAFEISISQSGATTFTDNNLASEGSVLNGVRTVTLTNIAVGDYTIAATIAVTNNPGTATLGTVQITNASVTRNGASFTGDLVIQLTATGFSQPISPVDLQSTGSITFGGSGSQSGEYAKMQSYFDGSDAAFGTATSPGQIVFSNVSSSGTSTTLNAYGLTYSSNYSLTNQILVNLNNGGGINTMGLTTNANPVPEPGSAILAAIGASVLGIGAWVRRRRQTLAEQFA